VTGLVPARHIEQAEVDRAASEPASMAGGARRPEPERQFSMDDHIRALAGRGPWPTRRGTNGIVLEDS